MKRPRVSPPENEGPSTRGISLADAEASLRAENLQSRCVQIAKLLHRFRLLGCPKLALVLVYQAFNVSYIGLAPLHAHILSKLRKKHLCALLLRRHPVAQHQPPSIESPDDTRQQAC